jgi:spermidine synthase
VGSIIGTFLPALVFIPWIGTKFTILVFAAIIILVGVTGFGSKKLFLVIPLLGIPFGTLDGVLKPSPGLILEAESPYQYVQVIEDEGSRYLVYNEGGGVQSVYHPDSVFTGGLYFDIASLLPVLSDGYQVLILGVAGGTIPRAMQVLYGDEPNFHVDGVEIDPMVGEIATEYFSLEQPRLTMQYADGRQVVERTDKQYDVVFVDAFTNQLYIPFHLTTQEFFEATRDRLLPGGVLSMNVNALGEDSELFQAITNTVASVFPWVYQMPSGIGNHMIFASERPIPFERLKEVALPDLSFTDFAPLVAASISDIRFDSRARVLTDDLAPVEHLTDKMFWEFFVERLRAE